MPVDKGVEPIYCLYEVMKIGGFAVAKILLKTVANHEKKKNAFYNYDILQRIITCQFIL